MISKNNKLYQILKQAQFEDREGRMPMSIFIAEIKEFAKYPENIQIAFIKLWMIEIVQDIEKLNFDQLSEFTSFLYDVKIRSDALFEILEIKLKYFLSQGDLNTIKKRAQILRFVVYNTDLFTDYELEKEIYIKEKFPWYFIDCMMKRSIEKSVSLIVKLARSEDETTQLMVRLLLWEKELPRDCFNEIINNLLVGARGKKKEKLERWIK
jgi:hypothetical protein